MNTLTKNSAQFYSREQAKLSIEMPNLIGKGIVTCAGSKLTLFNLHFLIKSIRHFGCNLPIEVWHLPYETIPEELKTLYENVTFIDCENVVFKHLGGWELKSLAILNSKFKEVIFLDSDNIPGFNVEELFEEDYDKYGTMFWNDFGYIFPHMKIYEYIDMEGKTLGCVESGQMVINKEKAWKALNFCNWINQNSEFFYQQKIYGDKDTFNLAWNKFETPYKYHKGMVKKEGIFIHKYKDHFFYHQNDAKKRDNSDFNPLIPFHKQLNEWKDTHIDWLIKKRLNTLYTIAF